MFWTVNSQGELFVKFVLMGAVISFCYDILRFFRLIIPHRYSAAQTEDVIYWLIMIFAVFSFFINESGGEIRLYTVFALLSGMMGYFFFISPRFMAVSAVPARSIRKNFCKIAFYIRRAIKKYSNLCSNKKYMLHFRGKYAKIKRKRK